MKPLNFEDVDRMLDDALARLCDFENTVDVPRCKEINNLAKTKILGAAKVLSYNQLNKRGTKIPFFEPKI